MHTMDNPNIQALADLLTQTAHAHHRAFIATDGVDPEWALWYAGYLKEPLADLLQHPLTRSRIVYELIRLDDEADTSVASWPVAYAKDLLAKYG